MQYLKNSSVEEMAVGVWCCLKQMSNTWKMPYLLEQNHCIFQHDWAPPHFASVVWEIMN